MSLIQGGFAWFAAPTQVPSSLAGSAGCAAIVARNIQMAFKSGGELCWVLKGIDLEIATGSFEVLMGPSGVGKTTLLSILAGILTPIAGQVVLLGQPLMLLNKAEAARFRLQQVGFIFQEFNLISALTVVENVELALNLKGIRGSDAHRQARSLLEQVNLGKKAKLLPRHLSGGEKQRVAIARGLAGDPRLLFADEPTTSLDSYNGQIVVNLLRQLAHEQGCTVLMATHDHRFIGLADRILNLEDGKIQVDNSR
jgi:putative ABC transport system ATP-binding protein